MKSATKFFKIIVLITFITMSFSSYAQSQASMNEDAQSDYKKADKELNAVYSKILSEYKSDAKFVAKLKASQNLWIKFRDAELEMKYPETDKSLSYGSVYPMCANYYLSQLTEARTKTLKEWLTGTEEGDVCSGSLKIK